MRQGLLFLLLLLFIFSQAFAQKPEGTWLMAYIKAKQPVLSATMQQGELVFDEGAPVDSSEVFTPGLMVFQFTEDKMAKSYSWDGNEQWRWSLTQDSLLMFSKKDTLYGSFQSDKMVLSSTIDAVPTEYTFLKVDDKLGLESVKAGEKGILMIEDHPFNNLEISFERDTVISGSNNIPGLELYLTTIGSLQVIEYSFDREHNKVELGIIYLFRERRKRYRGLFYPVIDDFRRPKELSLEIKF